MSSLSALTVPELKKELKKRALPVGGRKADLIARLQLSVGASGTQLELPPQAPKEKKKGGASDWKNCEAKMILYTDLIAELLPVDKNKGMTPREIYDHYRKGEPAFEGIEYKNFPDRLQRLRHKVADKNNRSKRDAEALVHDRILHPKPTHNHRGEPYWPDSKAKTFLEKDITEKKHLKMSKEKLWLSRPAYQLHDKDVFRGHVYQELKKRKFLAYCQTTKRGKEYGAQALLKDKRLAAADAANKASTKK